MNEHLNRAACENKTSDLMVRLSLTYVSGKGPGNWADTKETNPSIRTMNQTILQLTGLFNPANYPSATVDNRTDLSARRRTARVLKSSTIVTSVAEESFKSIDLQKARGNVRVVSFRIIGSRSRAIYDGVYFRKCSHSTLKISKKRRVIAMLLQLLLLLIDRT